jgi:hypothetical protein
MKAIWSASMIVALSAMTTLTAAAEEFDGSVPLVCTPQKAHDCMPTENKCNPLKRESKDSIDFGIDVAKKEVKSPFRTTTLPIETVDNNEQSLVLQGTDLQFAWSMVIHREKGTMTLTVADRKGAYVVFGQCKVAAAVAPAAP